MCDINICDFCMHYNFNGEWYLFEESWQFVYIEKGFCHLDGCYRDPYDLCDKDAFHKK